MNEIEKMFMQEVREKKRTGSGAFSKKGKGVKHGMRGIKFPYDYLSAKEKRLLNGKVEVTQMYETILHKDEFLQKDEATQKAMLLRWREIYPNSKIMQEMQINSSGAFHNIITSLDIPRKTRHGAGRPKGKKESDQLALPIKKEEKTSQPEKVEIPVTRIIANGLNLEWNGNYNCNEISKMFEKISLLVDEETGEKKYKLRLELLEV